MDERDLQLAASRTTVLSPALLNEARFLAATSSFDQLANFDRPGVDRPSGSFGGNNLNRQLRDEDTFQLVDNFTWQIGRHSVKLGADVARTRTGIRTRFNPNGNFLYETDRPFEPGDCGDLDISMVDPNDKWKPIPCPGQVGVDDDDDGVIDEPGIIGTYPVVFQLIEGAPAATLRDTRIPSRPASASSGPSARADRSRRTSPERRATTRRSCATSTRWSRPTRTACRSTATRTPDRSPPS